MNGCHALGTFGMTKDQIRLCRGKQIHDITHKCDQSSCIDFKRIFQLYYHLKISEGALEQCENVIVV